VGSSKDLKDAQVRDFTLSGLQPSPLAADSVIERSVMISIQQTLSELEKIHQQRTLAFECYLAAIDNMAHYTVELDNSITVPHRRYLSDLAAEVAAVPESLAESRSTLRGLLRDYRDRAAQYLGGLRDQLSSTAQALQEMVEALSQCDSDHTVKLRTALGRLREAARSPQGSGVRSVVIAVADTIEQSLEQIRKQHQFTISQFQTELRLLHGRIDALETAAAIDEATKFSNRRFITEYLGGLPPGGASFLILKLQGLAQARGRFGPAIADDLVATFGRRLRNTLPKDAVFGRWSEQDFLAITPVNDGVEAVPCQRVAGHLSMPYACMLGGKVVRIPLEVTAQYLTGTDGNSAEEILARVSEAFG
jgi:GGDEF domain-containing protein